MGGTDAPHNLVRLTPEEHFLAHQILVKLNPKNHKLICAALAMTMTRRGQKVANDKSYGWLRRQFGDSMAARKRGIPRLPEVREKLRKANLGKKASPEALAKMSATRKGRRHSKEHSAAISAALKGHKYSSVKRDAQLERMLAGLTSEQRSANARKSWETRRANGKPHPLLGKKQTEQHRQNAARKRLGRKLSPETKEKMRVAAMAREAKRRQERELVAHDTNDSTSNRR